MVFRFRRDSFGNDSIKAAPPVEALMASWPFDKSPVEALMASWPYGPALAGTALRRAIVRAESSMEMLRDEKGCNSHAIAPEGHQPVARMPSL
jgi:hypothetical protein